MKKEREGEKRGHRVKVKRKRIFERRVENTRRAASTQASEREREQERGVLVSRT